MRVLVITGSRHGTRHVEDLEREIRASDLVLHGGAPGVDTQAARIAAKAGIHCIEIKALWGKYGDDAGKLRNTMLAEVAAAFLKAENDVRYAAYPDERSVGTYDCVRRLTSRSIAGKLCQ